MSGGGLINISQFDGSARRPWDFAHLPLFHGLLLDLEQVTKMQDGVVVGV